AAPLASSTPVQRVQRLPLNTGKSKPPPKIILSNRNEPIGLNVADFLPVSFHVSLRIGDLRACAKQPEGGALSDDEALSQLKKGHDTMCVMLRSRHRNLETVRGVWARQDIKSALDAAVSMNDLSIVVDILNIINLQLSLWKLDLCTTVLPQIEQLLQSKYER
ncbi:hypothetical protein KUCAC02_020487, partial [Chaenocephalus aceratus]